MIQSYNTKKENGGTVARWHGGKALKEKIVTFYSEMEPRFYRKIICLLRGPRIAMPLLVQLDETFHINRGI